MRETEVKHRRSRLLQLLLVIAFAVLLMIGWQMINRNQWLPVDAADKSRIELRIPPASTAADAARLLKEHDLIRSESAFLRYLKKEKLDAQLKAGLYSLSRSQSVQEISRQLAAGDTVKSSFTIPEGYTVKQIGELLVKDKVVSREDWEKALQDDYDYDFLPAQGGEKRFEGYLFPDTYQVAEDSSAHEIINGMLKNFKSRWDSEFAQLAKDKGKTIKEAVIVASLVEKEAQVPSERKRIAGVIYNRLAIGMPLQIDATVLYSLGKHKEQITYADLKYDSPYNTYVYAGLPVGPIASPGTASIEAALSPEKHGYYYYVAKGDGSHYFSKTYAEHNTAIMKYQ